MSAWCLDQFGATPSRELFGRRQASHVVGVELTDGRSVVVKQRHDENGRAASCVAAQQALADLGFPCARPLTGVSFVDGMAVHAEEWRPGGEIRTGSDAETAAAFGRLYGRTMTATMAVSVPRPLPNPAWLRWSEQQWFPQLWWQADWVRTAPMPQLIWDVAGRIRHRLADLTLPPVLGHADWETQNLRWCGNEAFLVHDWDSLAWLPEAVLTGAAAGGFASNGSATLAPVHSSAAFLAEYQCTRGRRFSREESEVAWAASLWPAVYNARTQLMFDQPPTALSALTEQAGCRLALAGA